MQNRIFTVDFEFETVSVNKKTLIIPQKDSDFETCFERMFSVLEETNTNPTFLYLVLLLKNIP